MPLSIRDFVTFILVPILVVLIIDEDEDDDDYLIVEDIEPKSKKYKRLNVQARDVKADLYGTAFFEPWVGMQQDLYDYLWNQFKEHISEPRNIYFEYSPAENRRRKRRPCKISNENRFISFLHEMNENSRVWTTATNNHWNISSVSRDFAHCLIQYVRTFSDDWIKKLDDEQKMEFQGIWPEYPTAYKIVDGSMYRRRKTGKLPQGVVRKTYYDYKHKMPEAVDVQAGISPYGLCTELVTGGPGAMGDANLSTFLCRLDWNNSTLVDGTYPNRAEFIKPDGSDEHKSYRVKVEQYFGMNKTEWSMTGDIFRRSKRLHNLAIRASFTLSNQKRVWNMLMDDVEI